MRGAAQADATVRQLRDGADTACVLRHATALPPQLRRLREAPARERRCVECALRHLTTSCASCARSCARRQRQRSRLPKRTRNPRERGRALAPGHVSKKQKALFQASGPADGPSSAAAVVMAAPQSVQALGSRLTAAGGDGRSCAFRGSASLRRAGSRGQLPPLAAAPAESPAGGNGPRPGEKRSFTSSSEKARSVKGPGFRGGALTPPRRLSRASWLRSLGRSKRRSSARFSHIYTRGAASSSALLR